MDNFNIFQITNNFPPIIGGVGDYTYYLSQEFSKKGIKVTVVCRASDEVIESAGQHKGLEVRPEIADWDQAGIQRLLRIIAEEKPDWVILQYVPYAFQQWGVPLQLLFLAKALRKKTLSKLFIFFHEAQIRWPGMRLKYWPVALGQRLIARQLCRHADQIATSIPKYAELLKQHV